MRSGGRQQGWGCRVKWKVSGVGIGRAWHVLAALAILALVEPRGPRPAAAADFFDKPSNLVRLPLPADPDNPQAKPELSCAYYPRFMVKEVDLGEKGAEQLSIFPVAADQPAPACRRENAA